MHHTEDLGELASTLGGRAGEALADVAAARQAAAAAGRCYWVAHTYLAGDKWAEAAALFGRAGERIKDAQDKLGVSGGFQDVCIRSWNRGTREVVEAEF